MDLRFIIEVVIIFSNPNVFRIYRGFRRARIFRRCCVAAEFVAVVCGLCIRMKNVIFFFRNSKGVEILVLLSILSYTS